MASRTVNQEIAWTPRHQRWWMFDDWNRMDRWMATILWAPSPDPLIHSLRWVRALKTDGQGSR